MPAPADAPTALPRRLTLWPLVATIFFCVSGGPFGLEPVMQGGAWLGLLLIVLTPIVWAVPSALMTAELASAIPEEGGYYVWVDRAMGPFPAFLCAWWSWVYSWLDAAIYPTLFFAYVNSLFTLLGHGSGQEFGPWVKWGAGLLLIVPFTLLNVRGTGSVGRSAVASGALLLVPFAVLVALGLPQALAHPPRGLLASGAHAQGAIGAGLFVVMWNYLGWDSMSTVAGEVQEPRSTFPKALALSGTIIAASYALPAFVGVARVTDLSKWTVGSWTGVAAAIGGTGLAIAMTLAGVLSTAGQFSSVLLSGSRVPFALAGHGYLPPALTRLHSRYGTPAIAIGLSALFTAVLSYQSFKSLAETDVVLYSAGLVLEFAALVVLRVREPGLERPFKIPGGLGRAVLVAVVPTGLVAVALVNLLWGQPGVGAIASVIGIASGFAAYPVCAWARRRRDHGDMGQN